jgi:hypothetical protein
LVLLAGIIANDIFYIKMFRAQHNTSKDLLKLIIKAKTIADEELNLIREEMKNIVIFKEKE